MSLLDTTDRRLPVRKFLKADDTTYEAVSQAAGVSAATVTNVVTYGHRNQKVEDVLRRLYPDMTDRQLFGENRS